MNERVVIKFLSEVIREFIFLMLISILIGAIGAVVAIIYCWAPVMGKTLLLLWLGAVLVLSLFKAYREYRMYGVRFWGKP